MTRIRNDFFKLKFYETQAFKKAFNDEMLLYYFNNIVFFYYILLCYNC